MLIDSDDKTLSFGSGDNEKKIRLYSKEAFEIISHYWLKVGWNQKYPYTFSWLGRPIIQIPEDIIRIQEVIYNHKPDVIIETGIAHGGSLIFYASLCKLMGKGRVIGIDIEIRPHNRKAIEAHELFPYITLIEGSSVSDETKDLVKKLFRPQENVMVILDSCHTKDHVLKELEIFSEFVSPGSYIVATDGSMKDLFDVPRGLIEWKFDNPVSAVKEFLEKHHDFVAEQPSWKFNESELTDSITHWPMAYLRKKGLKS